MSKYRYLIILEKVAINAIKIANLYWNAILKYYDKITIK